MSDPDEILKAQGKGTGHETRFEIAAIFGNLTINSLIKMDDNLKLMMAGLVKALKGVNSTSWEQLLEYLDEIPYLQMFDSIPEGYHRGILEYYKDDLVKLGKEIDHTMKFNIENWFERFIGDRTLLEETKIDIGKLSEMAATQAFNYELKNLFYEKDVEETVVVDMAVLRFPDVEHPYFQAFVIKVYVRREYVRYLWKRKGTIRFVCKYNVIKYRPNEEYLRKLTDDIKETLLADIEDFFA
ncbi:uncharacterized protein LOC115228476 [Argonauta hians]